MTAQASPLLKELSFLCEIGSRNTFVDKYHEFSDHRDLIFYRDIFEEILLSFLEPKSFASRTLSPSSLEKLKYLAGKLDFSPEFKHCLKICWEGVTLNLKQNPQTQKQPGIIPLPLVRPGTDNGYIAEMRIFAGTGFNHPLTNRVAALTQEFSRRKKLPEFSLDPSAFACEFIDPLRLSPAEITGNSLALALLLALFSSICQEPLPNDITASAELDAAGKLIPINGIDAKLKALISERHYVKRIFVAVDQTCETEYPELEICRFSTIFELLPTLFPPAALKKIKLPLNIEETLILIERTYRQSQWESCIANATALINSDSAKLKKSALFTACSYRGAAYCHRGEIKKSHRYFEKAEQLYQSNSRLINGTDYFEMRNRKAVALKDVFLYRKARKTHAENREAFIRLDTDAATRARDISSFSQLLCARGDFPEALKLQKEALRLFRSADEDLARNYGYLADIQTRAGDFRNAKLSLKKARKFPKGMRDKTPSGGSVPFLDWYEAQLLFRRLEKSKGHYSAILKRLKILRSLNFSITSHAPAMVHKFANLGELLYGDQSALARLDEVIEILAAKTDSTYQLLAASIRIERQIIRLDTHQTETLKHDVDNIIKHLQTEPNTERFFRSQLKTLKNSCRYIDNSTPDKAALKKTTESLISLRDKIPY